MSDTVYKEAAPDDVNAALFVASHIHELDPTNLPVKVWTAATEEGKIVAALCLHTQPAVYLDFLIDDPSSRPFMRLWKLWILARAWLLRHKVPIVCATVRNELVHYQSIMKRAGFERIGEWTDADGNPVETIFQYRMAA